MIKSITVHPKGATHVQVLSDTTYFLKQTEGVWFFNAPMSRSWLRDEILNDEFHTSNPFCKTLTNKIGDPNVTANGFVAMPPVGVPSDFEVIF